MLKVNVGLSRKLSRDYNSTGFSLNLEGEICVGPDDPEAMIEKIKEFYDLADEALNQQIERYEGESSIASRDGKSPAGENGRNQNLTTRKSENVAGSRPQQKDKQPVENVNGHSGSVEAATNKQVQYLLNLGKRQGLSTPQLESRIESIVGKRAGVYDLTKREAGDIIDALSQNGAPATNGNGRSRTNR